MTSAAGITVVGWSNGDEVWLLLACFADPGPGHHQKSRSINCDVVPDNADACRCRSYSVFAAAADVECVGRVRPLGPPPLGHRWAAGPGSEGVIWRDRDTATDLKGRAHVPSRCASRESCCVVEKALMSCNQFTASVMAYPYTWTMRARIGWPNAAGGTSRWLTEKEDSRADARTVDRASAPGKRRAWRCRPAAVDAMRARPGPMLVGRRDLDRGFWLLWAGQGLSMVGSEIVTIAAPFVAVIVPHASARRSACSGLQLAVRDY